MSIVELKLLVDTYFGLRSDAFQNRYPAAYYQVIQITSFLPQHAVLKQRMYHVLHDLYTTKLCNTCSTAVKWKSLSYHTSCSKQCAAKDPSRLLATQNTNILRYGGKSPACNTSVQAKMASTLLAHYGELGLRHPEVQHTKQTTNRTKYGVDNVSQLESIKLQKVDSSQAKYGANHPMQHPVVQQTVKNTMLSKYGATNPAQVKEFRDNTEATNLARYGYTNPLLSPTVRTKIADANEAKFGVRHQQQNHLSAFAKQFMYDKDWLIDQHHTQKKTLTKIAHELQIDTSSLSQHFSSLNISKLSFGGSQQERDISDIFYGIDVPIIRNTKSIIPPKELDIYLPDNQLAIEFCGLYWHSTRHDRMDNNYHLAKLNECNSHGVRLITIFGDEWHYKSNIVTNTLKNIVGKITGPTIAARKTKVVSIDSATKAAFLTKYHIQGTGPGSITYGLTYDSQLVAVMTFIRTANNTFTLNRYATSCRVQGGFSKVLHHFKINHTWDEIISFADRRWSEGQVYFQNGFSLDKVLPPDYRYVQGEHRIHKFNFRHKNLKDKLTNYDPNLSESENTRNNGIYKIYDCGLLRFSVTNA